MIDANILQEENRGLLPGHKKDFGTITEQLSRRGIDSEKIIDEIQQFDVAIPSWALGTGGTRFGRFPGSGEPRNIDEKLEDISLIHQFTGAASSVSLHIPWDEPKDPKALKELASSLNLSFDAVNSNTFQDQAVQKKSYKFGSLSHTGEAVRAQAVEHNIHVIEVGKTLDSKSITIWLSDGSSFPGQTHFRKSFDRVLGSLQQIYGALPDDWKMFVEYKPYEPFFYSTVINDWGSSYLLANLLGSKAYTLVDLGHHLPNTNIEQVVSRLIWAKKLAGFHFNDSKYGDDDLTSGSIKPYQLFLIFNELVDAAYEKVENFNPSYMIDQSHNIKDPIEALLQTVGELQKAHTKALLVDRRKLADYQGSNDTLMAEITMKQAYETDVNALVAEARLRKGGAIEPISAFRHSGYRKNKSAERASGVYVPPQSL